MKALRFFTLASGFLSLLVLATLTYPGSAEAAAGRVLSGELVVMNPSTNQFRIVGHNGSFTAPAGTPIEALDGRNVRVELASNDRVTEVVEAPVPIDPVTHGWSTARGELVIVDAATRRFTLAGDDQVYVAPTVIDVTPYAGKMVELRLDETGRVNDMHLIGPQQTSYLPPPAATGCVYRGQTYSGGAAICQSGTQYRCDSGQWQSTGTGCQVSDAREVAPPRSPRSCIVGDATVASGSGICRGGNTFRCDDGTWIDSRTACR